MENIEEKYQKKELLEHILFRPDTYIGDVSEKREKMRIFDNINNKIIFKDINYSQGLYKIFDEILINASDRVNRNIGCNTIKVNIKDNCIQIWNNGEGIDVVMHKKEKRYVPELIFGVLLSSTNYNDNEERTTGGRNGYGAKLTNIFSTFFEIETHDEKTNKTYKQEYNKNMTIINKPIIKEYKNKKAFTKISFIPDYEKFGITELSEDMIQLFKKRTYDIAGINNNIKVFFNDELIKENNFFKYIGLY